MINTPSKEKKKAFPNNIHQSLLKYAVTMLYNDLKEQVNIKVSKETKLLVIF